MNLILKEAMTYTAWRLSLNSNSKVTALDNNHFLPYGTLCRLICNAVKDECNTNSEVINFKYL
jgi:hypothetical protein